MSDAQNMQFHVIVRSEMRGKFTFSSKCRLPAISDCMIRRFCLDWAVLVSDSVCCAGRVACIINGALHVMMMTYLSNSQSVEVRLIGYMYGWLLIEALKKPQGFLVDAGLYFRALSRIH